MGERVQEQAFANQLRRRFPDSPNTRRCSGASMTDGVTAASVTGVGAGACRGARGAGPRARRRRPAAQVRAAPDRGARAGALRCAARARPSRAAWCAATRGCSSSIPSRCSQRVRRPASKCPDSNRLAARYHQPVPFSDGARKSTFVYLGLSVGVLVLVGAVAYEWHQERLAAGKVQGDRRCQGGPETEAKPRGRAGRRCSPLPRRSRQLRRNRPKSSRSPSPVRARTGHGCRRSRKVDCAGEAEAVGVGPHRLVVRTEAKPGSRSRTRLTACCVSSLNPPGSERVVRGKPPYSLVIGNASNVTRPLRRQADRPRAAHAPGCRAPDRTLNAAQCKRRISRQVAVGGVRIGGGAPIVVQSMTNTDTEDAAATARQVEALARAGSELVRITVNTPRSRRAGGGDPRAPGRARAAACR